MEGLQRHVADLQAVLQDREAYMQTLRLRARFTQPEEARLESRRLLQESVRLRLELRAKRAQCDGRSAREPDVQRLEQLRQQHAALQAQHAAGMHRRSQQEERATSGWDALERCAGLLTKGLEQLEQAHGHRAVSSATHPPSRTALPAPTLAPPPSLGLTAPLVGLPPWRLRRPTRRWVRTRRRVALSSSRRKRRSRRGRTR